MDKKSDERPNLTQFKRYQRKFPWSLIIRLVFIVASIGVIYFLMRETLEIQKTQTEEEEMPFEIEILEEESN
jgi:cytoskeletal protein RodZ